jgi:hypothetical protein
VKDKGTAGRGASGAFLFGGDMDSLVYLASLFPNSFAFIFIAVVIGIPWAIMSAVMIWKEKYGN